MIPFQVFEIKSENELKRYKSIMNGYQTGASLQKAQMIKKHALEELEHTDIHEVLSRPNPAQSYSSFIQEVIAFGKLKYFSYIAIHANNRR